MSLSLSLSLSLSFPCPFTDLKKIGRELPVLVLADACVGVCKALPVSEGGGEAGKVVEIVVVPDSEPLRFNIAGLVPAR